MRSATVLALIAAATLSDRAAAQGSCAEHLLVSGYFSNNVAIFDACSGAFVRQLDSSGRIRGAQAVRLNPANQLIYVVSEGTDRILRYRASDYEFVDVFAQLPGNFDPTGIDFGLDDEVYVASYGTSSVVELDPDSGTQVAVLLPAGSGLLGADNGMMVSVSGQLFVPGYDSSSVAMINPGSGSANVNFIRSGTGGMLNARGILDEGATILVGGEGSGAVYRFSASNGALVQTLITGLSRPTGLTRDAAGKLLVLTGNQVRRYEPDNGALIGTLANLNQGGISGGTFLALVPNPQAASVDQSQIGSQYWVFGSGPAQARSLSAEMVSATGSVYGAGFDPDEVVRKRWGSITVSFTACDRAQFSADSSGPDSAGFGELSYSLVRLVDSEATLRCRDQGFDQATGNGWMSGAWYAIDRSGEGLVLELSADNIAVVSFYTHRPAMAARR